MMYHTPMYSEIVTCVNCGKEYDKYCVHVCKVKKNKGGVLMAAKTKRLKNCAFGYHEDSDKPLGISQGWYFVYLTKREAAALRDFLNQQDLPGKITNTHLCHFDEHKTYPCTTGRRLQIGHCFDHPISWFKCPYGREWKGAK